MKITLITDGNAFDRKYAHIASHFPKYEIFWSKYIGCRSGNGLESTSIEIQGIHPEKDKLRKLIWQWNYSILMDYVHLTEIKEDIPEYNIHTFTNLERIYILVVHITYHAIECISKINMELFKDYNPPSDIEEFKEYRNYLAHDVRPLVFLNLNYNVLKPEAYKTLATMKRGYIWSDLNMDKENYFSLNDYINRILGMLNSEFNRLLDREIVEFERKEMPEISLEQINEELPHPSAAAVEEDIVYERIKITPSASISERDRPLPMIPPIK